MAWNPTTNQWEDDAEGADVGKNLTGLLDQNNAYMKQARTQGLQSANKRGLLNSSIAVGASQGAAIDRALPIAQQQAAQVHQRNVSGQEYGQQSGLLGQQFEHETGMQGREFEQQQTLQTQQIGANEAAQVRQIQADAEAQGRQLTAQEQAQVRELEQQQLLQNRQIIANTDTQVRDIQAQAEAQGRDLTAQEEAQLRDLEQQRFLQTADFQQQLTLQAGEFSQRTAEQQAAITAATDDLIRQLESQENVSFANIAAHDREKAAALAASFEASYSEVLRTIGQNEALPASVRDTYLQRAADVRDSNYSTLESLYGIDITFEDAA